MRPASSCRQPRLPYTSPRAGSAISSPNGVTRLRRGMPVVCAVMTLVHRPATVEEVQEIVARAPRIRVVGSRHTFNDIADSDELISLDGLPPDIEIRDGTVS